MSNFEYQKDPLDSDVVKSIFRPLWSKFQKTIDNNVTIKIYI